MVNIVQLNPQALIESQNKANVGSGSDLKWFKLKAGNTYWHILPPWVGNTTGLPYVKIGIHFLTDADNKFRAYKCSKDNHGSCPMCVNASAVEAQNEAMGRKLKANIKYLYNAYSPEEGVEGILSIGTSVHNKIIYELNVDIKDGFNPVCYEQGLLIEVFYNKDDWRKTNARGQRQRHGIVNLMENYPNLPNLDTVYDDYTPQELAQVLAGNFDPKGKNQKTETPAVVQNVGHTPVAQVQQFVAPAAPVYNPAAVTTTQVTPPPVAPAWTPPVQQFTQPVVNQANGFAAPVQAQQIGQDPDTIARNKKLLGV